MRGVGEASIHDHAEPIVFLGNEEDPDRSFDAAAKPSQSGFGEVSKKINSCGSLAAEDRVPIRSDGSGRINLGQVLHLLLSPLDGVFKIGMQGGRLPTQAVVKISWFEARVQDLDARAIERAV